MNKRFVTSRGLVKRPITAYILFCLHMRPVLVNHHRSLSSSDVTKMLATIWRSMSQADKQPYFEQSTQLLTAHRQAFPGYKFTPAPSISHAKPLNKTEELLGNSVPQGGVNKTNSMVQNKERSSFTCHRVSPCNLDHQAKEPPRCTTNSKYHAPPRCTTCLDRKIADDDNRSAEGQSEEFVFSASDTESNKPVCVKDGEVREDSGAGSHMLMLPVSDRSPLASLDLSIPQDLLDLAEEVSVLANDPEEAGLAEDDPEKVSLAVCDLDKASLGMRNLQEVSLAVGDPQKVSLGMGNLQEVSLAVGDPQGFRRVLHQVGHVVGDYEKANLTVDNPEEVSLAEGGPAHAVSPEVGELGQGKGYSDISSLHKSTNVNERDNPHSLVSTDALPSQCEEWDLFIEDYFDENNQSDIYPATSTHHHHDSQETFPQTQNQFCHKVEPVIQLNQHQGTPSSQGEDIHKVAPAPEEGFDILSRAIDMTLINADNSLLSSISTFSSPDPNPDLQQLLLSVQQNQEYSADGSSGLVHDLVDNSSTLPDIGFDANDIFTVDPSSSRYPWMEESCENDPLSDFFRSKLEGNINNSCNKGKCPKSETETRNQYSIRTLSGKNHKHHETVKTTGK